jgi:broad specificity phosphatase PhoE
MRPCTLYLVRHGETQANVDLLIHGHSNVPLTKAGEQQAKERRDHLRKIHFAKIYSSDLIRANQTAEILNLDRKLPHETSELLRERNYGVYEGKPRETSKQLWEYLNTNPSHPHVAESKVETSEHMAERALPYLKKISVAHQGENILVVTHGGLMRVILIHLGYAKIEQFSRHAIPNLAYFKLECDGESFKVKGSEGVSLYTP